MAERRTPLARLTFRACAALTMTACGTTVVEDDSTSTAKVTTDLSPALDSSLPLGENVEADFFAGTLTERIEGTATDPLAEIGEEMSRLSGQVGSDEGRAALVRIATRWKTVRPEIQKSRPDLADALGVIVEMVTTAVETNRPADADKAFSLFNDLIGSYVGEER